jgi:hypothetical protein
MPPRPQTKLVITKAPKKKPLTIFATPLSHAGKQVVATPSPGSSKDSPIDLTEDNEQNHSPPTTTNYALSAENEDTNLNGAITSCARNAIEPPPDI